MIVAAVLVAGGSGSRLGADRPKAFVDVAGQTLLTRCIERFDAHVRDVIAVLPQHAAGWHAYRPVQPVLGGATRQQSVAAGLSALAPDVELVLVQDVARPFVPDTVIESVISALESGAEAVVPVVPVTDTLRRVGGGVVDRSALVAVQTPQGFRRAVLDAAHAAATGPDATDDAVLVEAIGVEVHTVPGSDLSFKITTPADLARAEAVARG